MKLVGIDVETTGLDTENDRITEIGLVVWDTDKRAPLYLYNVNLLWDPMPELTTEITALTGIDMDHLQEFHEPDIHKVFINIGQILIKHGVCVAHNAPFDKGMVATAFKLLGLEMPDLIDPIKKAGYSASPEDSLLSIAQRNNISAMLVFNKTVEEIN